MSPWTMVRRNSDKTEAEVCRSRRGLWKRIGRSVDPLSSFSPRINLTISVIRYNLDKTEAEVCRSCRGLWKRIGRSVDPLSSFSPRINLIADMVRYNSDNYKRCNTPRVVCCRKLNEKTQKKKNIPKNIKIYVLDGDARART